MMVVSELSGAEFADLKPKYTETGQLMDSWVGTRAAARRLTKEAKDYIYGIRETNPFNT